MLYSKDLEQEVRQAFNTFKQWLISRELGTEETVRRLAGKFMYMGRYTGNKYAFKNINTREYIYININ